jgi:hypothetical protein
MGPLVVNGIISENTNLFLAFLIGIGFGFVLEQCGFSSSRKLAGVFYGYDTVVLKVSVFSLFNRYWLWLCAGAMWFFVEPEVSRSILRLRYRSAKSIFHGSHHLYARIIIFQPLRLD